MTAGAREGANGANGGVKTTNTSSLLFTALATTQSCLQPISSSRLDFSPPFKRVAASIGTFTAIVQMSHVATEMLASPIHTKTHQQRLLDLLNLAPPIKPLPHLQALPQLDGAEERVPSANNPPISSTPTQPAIKMVMPNFDRYKYGDPTRRYVDEPDPTPLSPYFQATPVSSFMENILDNPALALAASSKTSDALLDTFDPEPTPSPDQKVTATLNHTPSTPITWIKSEGPKSLTPSTLAPAVPTNMAKSNNRSRNHSMQKRNSPSSVPHKAEPQVQSPEQLLKELQASERAKIGIRLRTQGDRQVTTSLTDLHLARTPAHIQNSDDPRVVEETVNADGLKSSKVFSEPTVTNDFTDHTTNGGRMASSHRGCTTQFQTQSPQLAPAFQATQTFSAPPVAPASSKLVPEIKFGSWATNPDAKSVEVKAETGSNGWKFTVPFYYKITQKTQSGGRASNANEKLAEVKQEPESNGWQSAVPVATKPTQKPQVDRWASNADVKAAEVKVEVGSNGWRSAYPIDGSTHSDDSVRAMQEGMLCKGPPAGLEPNLAGWDGKLQPPPVDWDERPRFNNNSPEFRNGFNNWASTAADLVTPNADRPQSQIIPHEKIVDLNLHPDGIGMVSRDFIFNTSNVSNYGYPVDIVSSLEYCQPYHPSDDEDWGKIDLADPGNTQVNLQHETTEILVQNWLGQIQRKMTTLPKLNILRRESRYKEEYKPAPNPHRPKANIYLRPVCQPDVDQLQALYNSYVQSGSARPSETKAISHNDMTRRLNQAESDRMPFIVACSRDGKNFSYDKQQGKRMEKIVGFACASDFTAPDYVEHITAEVEVYVHKDFRRQGVGRCLLDKLMEATDPGHLARGGYQWTCDPALLHCYNSGGARELGNIIFVVRHFTKPEKNNAEQNDYNNYLKKWLVNDWEFEEQGCLRGIGAKAGKRLNIAYLVKETKWLPAEGRVPGPKPF